MKTIPTALAAHYASGTTTLADLLKITRKDGQVFAFTSASTDVTISGQLYTSAQGLDISSLEVTAGLAVDNLELTTLDDGTIFSRVEVLAGVWRNADFIISRYNWASPGDGIEVRMVGTVGEVHLKRGSITAELRGLQQYLQQPIGSVTSKTCRARLGDSLCRVVLTGYTFTGSVTASSSQQVFIDATKGGDTFYSNVSLLLNANGANGSTTFTDGSSSPKSVTVGAGAATISTAQSKFEGSSIGFSNGYLNVPTSADFQFPADLTVEGWYYLTSSANQGLFGFGSNQNNAVGGGLYVWSGTFRLYWNNNFVITGPAVTTNTWLHIALTRSGGVWRLFINGALFATTYTNAVNINEGIFKVGASPLVDVRVIGFIDDFRVTKGLARYTAEFAPPFSQYAVTAEMFALNYFAEGLCTWNTGNNAGLTQKIKSFDNGAIQLSLPMIQPIQFGDAYTITAGCQKRLSDCSGKFANAINFQGEPHLPGIDAVTS